MGGGKEFRDGVPFLGGALWIDLLNTTPVMGGVALDLVGDPARLQAWSALAQLESGGAVPQAADVREIAVLRDGLRTAFEDLAAGRAIGPQVIETVNAVLGKVRVTRQIVPQDGVPHLAERVHSETGPVAAAAALDFASFVANHDPARLKHCENPACTMVFYDQGKNRRRRWCSTRLCGNQDKVANYRARQTAKPPPDSAA